MSFFGNHFLNIYYNVKFSQKEEAKKNGLRWDPDIKKWHTQHELFKLHNGDINPDVNGMCDLFDIVEYKITDKFNRDCREYNHINMDDMINTVNEKYEQLKIDKINRKKDYIKRFKKKYKEMADEDDDFFETSF